MNNQTTSLYRPVGLKEMQLILDADSKAFPPRLPHQPIFYPVLNFEYAEQIARDWNTKDGNSGFAGFVTRFEIDGDYVSQFPEHVVGTNHHRELWIPAEELNHFNQRINGHIQLIAAYYREGYRGLKHFYGDWYADEMFEKLYQTSLYSAQDFSGEFTLNRNAILLNFSYWLTKDYSGKVFFDGEQKRFLNHMAEIWRLKYPDEQLLGANLLE
ncbi:MAG: hypothetical protein K8L99_19800 [Anaerolineae bacterium]|nr:hypothetical protein [Anaerolineae bacterium]